MAKKHTADSNGGDRGTDDAAQPAAVAADPGRAVDHLVKEIDTRTDRFHGSVGWFRRRFYVASMAAVLLSALITVIAGWNPGLDVAGITASNVVLVLGAGVTVVSAWSALYSPKESWLVYARTLERLRGLQSRIRFLKEGTDPRLRDPAFVDELFGAYQAILDAHNVAWAELRAGRGSDATATPIPLPGAVARPGKD